MGQRIAKMSKKRLPLPLSPEDRQYLETYVNTGKHSARSIKRARALLSVAADEPIGVTVQISGLSEASIYNIKQRFRAEGLPAALATFYVTAARSAAGIQVQQFSYDSRSRVFAGDDDATLSAPSCELRMPARESAVSRRELEK